MASHIIIFGRRPMARLRLHERMRLDSSSSAVFQRSRERHRTQSRRVDSPRRMAAFDLGLSTLDARLCRAIGETC